MLHVFIVYLAHYVPSHPFSSPSFTGMLGTPCTSAALYHRHTSLSPAGMRTVVHRKNWYQSRDGNASPGDAVKGLVPLSAKDPPEHPHSSKCTHGTQTGIRFVSHNGTKL